jgi:hypothetical protein
MKLPGRKSGFQAGFRPVSLLRKLGFRAVNRASGPQMMLRSNAFGLDFGHVAY